MYSISESSIILKPVRWAAASHRELKAFPREAQHAAGVGLLRLQHGLLPRDGKPMEGVGRGVCELRVRVAGSGVTHDRVLYVARFPEAVYVLHAFEKKTRATPRHHLDVARARYRKILRERTGKP